LAAEDDAAVKNQGMKAAMKRVLLVYYSQTGQLRRGLESMAAPLHGAGDIELERCELRPLQPYPFPWPFFRFFDAFPEAVHLDPPPLQPLGIPAGRRYDLVILAYTVWFLSPSPPVTAFLKSPEGRALLADTPVVTLIVCRNMWHLAQEQVKRLLREAQARLSDNVVLTDAGGTLSSFVTTPRWMLTGRSDAFWGFPAAGVRDGQIRGLRRFGLALADALRNGRLDGRAPVLTGLGAVQADVGLVTSEKIGRRSFRLWGLLIRRLGPPGSARRKPLLLLYVVFLVSMILTIVPASLVLRRLLAPLAARHMAARKRYFELPSGSARDRLGEAAHD
jgi:hypothetical protein